MKYNSIDEIQKEIEQEGLTLERVNEKNNLLEKAGRAKEMYLFPWDIIDFENPEEKDVRGIQLLEKSMVANGWNLDKQRLHNCLRFFQGLREEDADFPDRVDVNNLEDLRLLSRYYYSICDVPKAIYYSCIFMLRTELVSKCNELEESVILMQKQNANTEYRMLLSNSTDTVVFVVDRASHLSMYERMADQCKYLDKRAFLIMPPIEVDLEETPLTKEEALALSYENLELRGSVNYMTYVRFVKGTQVIEDTLLPLLDNLSLHCKGNQLLMFSERGIFRTMKSSYVKRSAIHYAVTDKKVKGAPYCTTFGYINGYVNYSNLFYKCDMLEELKKDSSVDFSIVLPVRNNAETLKYTLRTCLAQNYDSYEILVSDNSDEENDSVYRLIESEFPNNKKIRYIRTPEVFPLTKSFEYAFMKAKGEFVIPIGADDGLILNVLPVLKLELEKLREQGDINFVTWDRLHYVWPSLTESGQESQFIVPRMYHKGERNITEVDSLQQLKDILIMPQMAYSAPLLYINSGFRRKYLLEVLEKTGAILDGPSQDIYTGIMNLALTKSYYHLDFPITIAALSGASTGAASIIGSVNKETISKREKNYFATNVNCHCQRDSEDLFKLSDGDVANMITQVIRLIDMEVLDADIISWTFWENIGKRIYEQMQKQDIMQPIVKKKMLHSISLFSTEAAKKIQRAIEKEMIHTNNFKQIKGKSYETGFSEQGALKLDASKFGVENVWDACLLFDNIYNIY